MSRLEKEGWKKRPGKGDHVNYRRADSRATITMDTGKKEIPKGTYSKIARLAGWK
jgi:predicted RNA binding protein YcfA (HicA-like mRNA interferase family)